MEDRMEKVENAEDVAVDENVESVEIKKKEKKGPKGLGSNLKKTENILGWVYISPMLIGLLVFTAVPLIMSIMAMFYEWDGIHGLTESPAAGFKHFASIFGGLDSKTYWQAFGNTLKFAIQLPVGLILGLFLALGMNRDMKGVQAFRVIYYLPGVMSIVAVSIVWQNLFKADGSINQLIMGMGGKPVQWLNSNGGVTFTVNLLLIWKGVGYTSLMFVAGLQSVSTDQIEAAKIDGANSWTILLKITLPALYPIIFYLFVTGLMGAMQMFNEPFILLGGYGVGNVGMTTVSFVYYFFGQSNLGLASVGAWILALIIFILTAIQMFVDKKMREDG